jgi:Lsr2
MAQKYIVQLVDDLTQESIDDGQGESVTFGIDGVSYQIDLSSTNADSLRQAFAPYVSAARKATGSARSTNTNKSAASSKTDLKAVRDWAAANGYEVSSRGRVATTVQEAYRSAH